MSIEWKALLRQFPRGELNPTGLTKIEHAMHPSRLIYWDLIDNINIQQGCKELWDRELGLEINPDDWKNMYPMIMKCTKSTKLRFFQYRLLNRRLVANVLRNK